MDDKKTLKISLVLGLVGSVLALVFAGLIFADIVSLGAIDPDGLFYVPSALAGVLGLIGCIVVRFRRSGGGTILIISGCLTLPNIVSTALVIASAVYALKPYAPESASQAVAPRQPGLQDWENGVPTIKI
jgi:hypothetical protein